MKNFNDLEKVNIDGNLVIALGNFDGVHIGHQRIILRAKELAKSLGIKSAVFTFSNHPKNMIPGKKEVKNIIYKDEKEKLIESLGIDYLFDIPFTKEIMELSPEDYVKKILVDKLNCKGVCTGFNYSFGHFGKGNPELLKELGEKYNFIVDITDPITVDNEVVSSTLIRELIKSGDMDECDKFLGRNYAIQGEVVVGNRIGKSIGFPTSNIMIDDDMVSPLNGVYQTYAIYNGIKYPSITNVGVKPTIGTFKKNIETHIFNFNNELYGKVIKIEFIKLIREEAKFSDISSLTEQIRKDCLEVKKLHGLD